MTPLTTSIRWGYEWVSANARFPCSAKTTLSIARITKVITTMAYPGQTLKSWEIKAWAAGAARAGVWESLEAWAWEWPMAQV